MGFKCTPQVMGLIRGEPKGGQKHRANGRRILEEAGSERYSSSVTLDRTKSYMNEYSGFTSGSEAWEEIERRADAYRVKGKKKDGTECERKLRSDAVVGFAVIFNPPYEMCKDWDNNTYMRFYNDSWDCLCAIEPKVFSDRNVLMDAEHFDEGVDAVKSDRHLHRFGEAKDSAGRYCGNLIDARLLSNINKSYPQMMRSRGWEIEDLDVTDWERYKTDAEYRAHRKVKLQDSRKSVNSYVESKLLESQREAEELVNELKSMKTANEAELERQRLRLGRKLQRWQHDVQRMLLDAGEELLSILQDDREVTSYDSLNGLIQALQEAKEEVRNEADRREEHFRRQTEELECKNRELESKARKLEDDLTVREENLSKQLEIARNLEADLSAEAERLKHEEKLMRQCQKDLNPASVTAFMLKNVIPTSTKDEGIIKSAGSLARLIGANGPNLDKRYREVLKQVEHRRREMIESIPDKGITDNKDTKVYE